MAACTDAGNLKIDGSITTWIIENGVPNLEMAGTLLHEGMHAEIYKYVDEHHDTKVDPNDRKRLWDLYSYYGAKNGKDIGTSVAQHFYMTEHYVEPLAKILRQLDGNKYDLSYYRPVAWIDLESYGLDG